MNSSKMFDAMSRIDERLIDRSIKRTSSVINDAGGESSNKHNYTFKHNYTLKKVLPVAVSFVLIAAVSVAAVMIAPSRIDETYGSGEIDETSGSGENEHKNDESTESNRLEETEQQQTDIEASVPILFMEYDNDYRAFFANLEDKSLKPLKFERLQGVFDVISIVCDPYMDGYSFGNYAGSIKVISETINDNAESMIEYHKKSKHAGEEDEFIVYNSYDELDKLNSEQYTDPLKRKYFCMIYKKEGINVYALQYVFNPEKYQIYFTVGVQAFCVRALTFTYPHREFFDFEGMQGERIVGKLRAKDEWENVCNQYGDRYETNEALIELSDVTTESSALIRALKEAVGMDG